MIETATDFPHVTAAIAGAGLIDDEWFTEDARSRGVALHQAVRFLDEGDLDRASVDPRIAGRLAGYERFLFEVGPRILAIEERVRNETYRYCGRLDRLVVIKGAAGILDLKPPGRYPWHALQVAAYAGCFKARLKRWTLHLDNEKYRLIEHTDRNDFAVFLAALTLHNWKGGN